MDRGVGCLDEKGFSLRFGLSGSVRSQSGAVTPITGASQGISQWMLLVSRIFARTWTG